MYNIAVKIEGFESRRRSAGILHVVAGFFLLIKGADYYRYSGYHNFVPVLPIFTVASISLFYGFFRRKMDPFHVLNYWLRLVQVISFTTLGVMMTKVGFSLDYIGLFTFSFLCIILLFSERRIFVDTIIYITEEGVRIPGYYKEHLVRWQDLSNVSVREDFVTFFHVKGKYLQFQVMQDLSMLEVAKMNAFCRDKIEQVKNAIETNQ